MRRLRREAIAALGSICVRCGIAHPIEIDHVNDDGNLLHKRIKNGYNRRTRPPQRMMAMHKDIIQNGGQGKYQLLCANCNRLKQLYPEDYAKPSTYGPLCSAAL